MHLSECGFKVRQLVIEGIHFEMINKITMETVIDTYSQEHVINLFELAQNSLIILIIGLIISIIIFNFECFYN